VTAFVPVPAAAVPPENAGPGLLGFLAIFGVALVTVLLMRSMVGHLRKVRYGPSPDGDAPGDGGTDAAPPADGPSPGPGTTPER
jgi:hypothetical protein